MTEKIAFELRCNNRLAGCITIKIRYSDFQTFRMQSAIPFTSQDFFLLQKAKEIFNKLYNKRLRVRLLGVRFSNFTEGSYQIKMFEDSSEMSVLSRAIDSVKKQFGEKYLVRAACL